MSILADICSSSIIVEYPNMVKYLHTATNLHTNNAFSYQHGGENAKVLSYTSQMGDSFMKAIDDSIHQLCALDVIVS